MESWEQMINLHQAVTMLRNESGNQVHYHGLIYENIGAYKYINIPTLHFTDAKLL